MLNDFFKLNGEFETINTQDKLLELLKISDSLKNILYKPDIFAPDSPNNRLRKKKFVNVSFSKTVFEGITFIDCHFVDCLFIGTLFKQCEFHDCSFKGCNPYKCKFENTYIDPNVFIGSLDPRNHSNIGVSLFQRLMHNSADMRQPEFTHSAEYLFRKWKRYQLNYECRKKLISRRKYIKKWLPNLLYDLAAGYGLKTKPFLIYTLLLFSTLFLVNHIFWDHFCMQGVHGIINERDPVYTFYFTVVTITTLGFGDITPTSKIGMAMAGIEALFGILWLSILASVIIRKVVR